MKTQYPITLRTIKNLGGGITVYNGFDAPFYWHQIDDADKDRVVTIDTRTWRSVTEPDGYKMYVVAGHGKDDDGSEFKVRVSFYNARRFKLFMAAIGCGLWNAINQQLNHRR